MRMSEASRTEEEYLTAALSRTGSSWSMALKMLSLQWFEADWMNSGTKGLYQS